VSPLEKEEITYWLGLRETGKKRKKSPAAMALR
jgi:hypothetical protein